MRSESRCDCVLVENEGTYRNWYFRIVCGRFWVVVVWFLVIFVLLFAHHDGSASVIVLRLLGKSRCKRVSGNLCVVPLWFGRLIHGSAKKIDCMW